MTKIPRQIRIAELIRCIKKSENKFLIKPPIKKELHVKIKDITKRIVIEENPILVFFIPYVIPIPRESMLTESARIIEFNILYISHLLYLHNMKKTKEMD